MRRIRNPRYAPELLEKKLSPSDFGLSVPVEVSVLAPSTFANDDPEIPVDPNAPPPMGPDAPPQDPLFPGGLIYVTTL